MPSKKIGPGCRRRIPARTFFHVDVEILADQILTFLGLIVGSHRVVLSPSHTRAAQVACAALVYPSSRTSYCRGCFRTLKLFRIFFADFQTRFSWYPHTVSYGSNSTGKISFCFLPDYLGRGGGKVWRPRICSATSSV